METSPLFSCNYTILKRNPTSVRSRKSTTCVKAPPVRCLIHKTHSPLLHEEFRKMKDDTRAVLNHQHRPLSKALLPQQHPWNLYIDSLYSSCCLSCRTLTSAPAGDSWLHHLWMTSQLVPPHQHPSPCVMPHTRAHTHNHERFPASSSAQPHHTRGTAFVLRLHGSTQVRGRGRRELTPGRCCPLDGWQGHSLRQRRPCCPCSPWSGAPPPPPHPGHGGGGNSPSSGAGTWQRSRRSRFPRSPWTVAGPDHMRKLHLQSSRTTLLFNLFQVSFSGWKRKCLGRQDWFL